MRQNGAHLEHHGDLTPQQTRLLQRVAREEFINAVTVPEALHELISHGYVIAAPRQLFPVMPARYDYRLSTLGMVALRRQAAG